MKILYDYQAFGMQSHGGVSRGFVEMICRLKHFNIDWEIAIKETDNIYLKNKLPEIKLSGKFKTKTTFCNKYRFKGKGLLYDTLDKLCLIHNSDDVNQKYSIEKIKSGDYDIFHPSFFDTYFINFLDRKKPLVLTIHDMIPEICKKIYGESLQVEQKRQLIKYATNVIVPSNNTKRDVVDILKFPEDKIKVIHWGADILSEDYLQSLKRMISNDYLLYVGSRLGYKGFDLLLKEFAKIRQTYKNLHLICTGKPFSKAENALINRLNLTNYVSQKFVNQMELHSLYHYATAFVYPSLYEGFGIPIYEAYSCHCPVFLNDASCFREVGEDAAIYFNQDRKSSNFCEKFIEYMIDEQGNKTMLIEKERKCIAKSTWDETAKQYADFYKSII